MFVLFFFYMYNFTYNTNSKYNWIPLFCFFQVIEGAKSGLDYHLFDVESPKNTKKCELNKDDTNDGDVSLSLKSPTESDDVSFSLQYTFIYY
jgi:hypothetical protein